jgi:heat shock protein HslJ
MNRNRIAILILLIALIGLSACGGASGLTLDGTSWELESMAGMALIEGRSITLNFDVDEVDGNAGCNHYFGGYTLNRAGGLQFGMIGMTEMACLDPEGIMQQESTYLSYLGTIVKAVREGNQLRLQDAAGDDVLIYGAASE